MEHNDTDIRIAETIRALRQHKGINQETLATALAVSIQAVSKWETGASVPDVMMIPRIAAYFGVTTDHVYFGGEMPMEAKETAPVSLFPDDGVLRVVQFMGGVMLSAGEAKAGEVIELSLNEAAELTESTGKQIVIPMEVHGPASFSGIHNGDVKAEGNVTCGTVNGDVRAEGDVSCGTVNGNASAGQDLRSPTVNGNASAGGNIMADRVAGGLGDFSRDLGRFGRELGKAFRFGRSHAGPAPDLPFPDDGVLRVVQFIGTRPAVWTERDAADPIPLEIELAAEQQKTPVVNVQIFGSAEIVGGVNGSASADGDLTCGDVGMNASADGDLTCGDVRGNVSADGDVNCGNVSGNLTSDGDVTCVQVNGNVTTDGDVSCESVGGSVTTDGDVSCESVGGSVTAEGDVNCGDVAGSVTSESDVTCGNVGKDVSCEGSLSCGNIQGSVKNCEGSIQCGNIGGNVRCEGDVHFK